VSSQVRGSTCVGGPACKYQTSGLYYKPITIVNDDLSVINNLDTSLIDDARVVIYNHHTFIVQATGPVL